MILTFVLNGSCESFGFSPLNWKLHYQHIALPDDDFLVDLVYPGTNEFWSKCCQKKKKSLIKLQGQLRYLNGKFSDNLKVPKVIIKQLVWSKKGEKYSKKRFEPGSDSWSFGRVKSRKGLSSADLLTVVLNPVVSYQAWSIRTQSVESFRTHTNTVCFPCWLC